MSFVEVLNHLMKETSTSNLALGKAVGTAVTKETLRTVLSDGSQIASDRRESQKGIVGRVK